MKPNIKYQGQALQDKFVCNVLKHKKNGTYVEVGSSWGNQWNNTYVLEKNLAWTGLMLELKDKFERNYKKYRPNSRYVFGDATKHDYSQLFENFNLPHHIDYLQLDIDPAHQTWSVLKLLNEQVMDVFKFAVITYEHDYWREFKLSRELKDQGPHNKYRLNSRKLLKSRGYYPVFYDIVAKDTDYIFEDWYVHPELVDMDYVKQLQLNNQKNSIPGIGEAKTAYVGTRIKYH